MIMPTKVLIKEVSGPEVEGGVGGCGIAIIPLGSMEPQPPILPVGADTFVIEGLVQRGAQMVADEVGAVVLPAFDFGSPTGPALTPEALNLPWDILIDLLDSIFADLYRQGFRRFVLVNGHGSTGTIRAPEQPISARASDDGKPRMGGEGYSYQTSFGFAYDAAAQFVEHGPDVEFFFVSAGGFFRKALPAAQTAWWQGGGEGDLPLPVKTSILLALHPELIDLSQAANSENSDVLISSYRFLGDPRYGVGAVLHRQQFKTAADENRGTPPAQLPAASPHIGHPLFPPCPH